MINLFIIDPSNLNEKYKLEFSLQKIFYDLKYFKINLIPSKYPQYKYFNKFLSLIDYFENKNIKDNSFYCDHDIFIKNKKIIKNMYKHKIFLKYNHINYYNWEEKRNELKVDINIDKNINTRYSSCFFPLYTSFVSEIKKELKNLNRSILDNSGTFEEYFFTKIIQKNSFKIKEFLLNDYNSFLYVMHFYINNKFIFNLLKKDKNIKNNLKQLENIYKYLKTDKSH